MTGSSAGTIKAIVRRILDGQVDDDESTLQLFEAAFDTADFNEAVSAFLEKRSPRFRSG